MNALSDPTSAEQCIYSQAHLLRLGISLFLMHLGLRRQLTLNVLFCCEQAPDAEDRLFVWMSNFHLRRNNIESIAGKGLGAEIYIVVA